MEVQNGLFSQDIRDLISAVSLAVMILIAVIGGIIAWRYRKSEWSFKQYEVLKNIVKTLYGIKRILAKTDTITIKHADNIHLMFDDILPDSEKYGGFWFRVKINTVNDRIKNWYWSCNEPKKTEDNPYNAKKKTVDAINEAINEAKNIVGLTLGFNATKFDTKTITEVFEDIFNSAQSREDAPETRNQTAEQTKKV